jgi:hypothetical protein
VAVALLFMLSSLIMPAIGFLVMTFGIITSFVFLSALLGRMTGLTDQQMVLPKILCISISIFLMSLFSGLVGSAIINSAISRMNPFGMLTGLGSLIP